MKSKCIFSLLFFQLLVTKYKETVFHFIILILCVKILERLFALHIDRYVGYMQAAAQSNPNPSQKCD